VVIVAIILSSDTGFNLGRNSDCVSRSSAAQQIVS